MFRNRFIVHIPDERLLYCSCAIDAGSIVFFLNTQFQNLQFVLCNTTLETETLNVF